MRFSAIIPVKSLNSYIHETVRAIQSLSHRDWEILIITNDNEENTFEDNRITLIASGRVAPGIKRDIGAKLATGEILVFLDDDSYPSESYFEIAMKVLEDDNIDAIGGPGITPDADGLAQKISGGVFLSGLAGGYPERYSPIGRVRPVTDWPSVNLLIRRRVFNHVNGFDTDLWPGEDTVFCSKLINKGYQIHYVPELTVFHHRRQGILDHLFQVFGYGRQRGFLASKQDPNSLSWKYFIPLALLLFTVLTAILPLVEVNGSLAAYVILIGWTCYGLAMFKALIDIAAHLKLLMAVASTLLIYPTHLAYGLGFLIGFISPEPITKLR